MPIGKFSRIGADEHQPAAVCRNGIDRIGLLRNRERGRIEGSAGVQELDPDTLATPRKCHDDAVMTGFRAGVLDRIGEQFGDAETRAEYRFLVGAPSPSGRLDPGVDPLDFNSYAPAEATTM